jgi:hypothetical protein
MERRLLVKLHQRFRENQTRHQSYITFLKSYRVAIDFSKVHIKLDEKSNQSGNLWIEISHRFSEEGDLQIEFATRAKPYLLIGNYQEAFLFSKGALKKVLPSLEIRKTSTSIGAILPTAVAHKIAIKRFDFISPQLELFAGGRNGVKTNLKGA